MNALAQSLSGRTRTGRFFCASPIEHLLDWAEPTIRAVCQGIWFEVGSTRLRNVMDLEDLHQEGRIAVFERARYITRSHRPRAMAAAIVRSRVWDAVRRLAPRTAECRPQT